MAKREVRKQNTVVAKRAYNAKEHLVGEHLPDTQQVFHVKVVSAFLRAGVPLTKLQFSKELLKRVGIAFLTSTLYLIFHLSKKTKKRIAGCNESIIFDSACYLMKPSA